MSSEDELRKLFAAFQADQAQVAGFVLQRSVMPTFVANRHGRPERLGSCVLVSVDRRDFVMTAAHAIQRVTDAQIYMGLPGGSLVPMPSRVRRFSETDEGELDERLDLAVMPYGVSEEGWSSCCFLDTESMELSHQVNPDRRALREYLVFGYSIARSQVQIDHREKHIKQTSLQLTTSAVEPGKYFAHGLSSVDQLVLEYDHERIDVDGLPTNMPQLQGVSGGGVFHLPVGGPARLVAIATEHLKPKRVIVATRVAHAVRLARNITGSEDPRVFL